MKFNKRLVNRIDFICRIIAMIICIRYIVKQKQCRFSSLFKKCSKCVKRDKKCESSVLMIDFNSINQIMIKLKRVELKIKIV